VKATLLLQLIPAIEEGLTEKSMFVTWNAVGETQVPVGLTGGECTSLGLLASTPPNPG
jgi:hypothetical protein